MKAPTQTAYCEYHGPRGIRSDEALWPQMQRYGWRDTLRHGWVCPACLVTHPDLSHLKARDHSRHEVSLP